MPNKYRNVKAVEDSAYAATGGADMYRKRHAKWAGMNAKSQNDKVFADSVRSAREKIFEGSAARYNEERAYTGKRGRYVNRKTGAVPGNGPVAEMDTVAVNGANDLRRLIRGLAAQRAKKNRS
jgi:hypothetical protein